MRVEISDKTKAASSIPKEIWASTLTTVDNEVYAAVGRHDTIKRAIRCHQRGKLPSDPITLNELKVEGEWSQTSGPRPETFLIHDSGPETSQRLIIFGTDVNFFGTWMAVLVWHHVSSSSFTLSELQWAAVTCVYAVLSGKTQAIYEGMLKAILDTCEELEHSPYLLKVDVDIEETIMDAVHVVLGNHVDINDCFYHLKVPSER